MLKSTPIRGAPTQIEVDTLDSLLRLVRSELNCISPDQHDEAWALLRRMVIAVIDEVKNSDASTDVDDSIEDVNDFLVTSSRCEFSRIFKRRDR